MPDLEKNKFCPICDNIKSSVLKHPTCPSLWQKTCGNRECVTKLTQSTNLKVYGHSCNLHQETESGKTVLQETIMSKYGVDNISQLAYVKEKKIQTCLENFGVMFPMQSKEVMIKSVKTLMEKYGVDNISKYPPIIQKIYQTQIDRYGDLYVRTSECKEKMMAAIMEKYGVQYYFQSDEFKEKYSALNPFYSKEVQAKIAKKNAKGISKGETKWLTENNIPEEYRQHTIIGKSGKFYIVDGFNVETNTVYEFNGSFWHGNPEFYKEDEIHPITGTTFGFLYQKTLSKERDILDAGYNYISVWG